MTEVVPPVLVKDGGLFLVSRPDGEISAECGGGFGLFYRDTRYLSRYALKIGGKPLLTLMTSAARGDQAVYDMTNDKVRQTDGRELDVQSTGVRLERTLVGEDLCLTDRIFVRNYTVEPIALTLRLAIDALFEDLFELRGAPSGKRGPARRVTAGARTLDFHYEGADGVARRLHVSFSRAIRLRGKSGAQTADVVFKLKNQASGEVAITFSVHETGAPMGAPAPRPAYYDRVEFRSDDPGLDQTFSRSLRDLIMLRTGLEDTFIAGGLPWFVSAFARDSLLSALQTLAFDTRPAEGVARMFAAWQGKTIDEETGEQPGKIHHELRLGAVARLKEVPHRPSYMSVDSTPLFLILIGEHARQTADRTLFRELRPAIDAALAWIDGFGDSDGDGYLDYQGQTDDGPINQGWKDSTLGVPRKDGGVPQSPIALCEVQGYVYLAKTLIADILRGEGEGPAADALEAQAEALRERFNRDFWMEDEGCYALALEKGRRQVTVVTSNAGHALWTGIADPDKAARTAARLMRPDMSSGWGIRTLSEKEKAYNPLNYHLGSVWPFDTSLIVAGLRRYGLDDAALELFENVVAASRCFDRGRLPEFYVGLAREPDLSPARCPFAEPMQAWLAGATPYMLATLLGLARVAGKLRATRPILPKTMRRVVVAGLWSGDRSVDCAFERGSNGDLHCRIAPARPQRP